MSQLSSLAAQILVGTARRPASLPTAEGPIGDLLTALSSAAETPELAVLRSAGALAICAHTGYCPNPAAPATPPCPDETRKALTEGQQLATLHQILADGPDRLRAQAFAWLAQNGYCLPPRLLPLALNRAHQHAALIPYLAPVLGQRGRWLAAQNAHWHACLADTSDPTEEARHWEEGNAEARLRYFCQIRRRAPARARALLVARLGELDARERTRLLDACAVGLSAEDEAFVEPLLRDRSKEVRQSAAKLLARLPDSAYVERMKTRVLACLRHDKSGHLHIEAPESFASEWKHDAVEENRFQDENMGQRAWWLYQLARAIPLAWWQALRQDSPDALLDWAAQGDWQRALLLAWHEALLRENHPAWASAMLALPAVKGIVIDPYPLIAMLPAAAREAQWLQRLQAQAKASPCGEVVERMLKSCAYDAPPLSSAFAQSVFDTVRQGLETGTLQWDYPLRTALVEFACLIPPQSFAAAGERWPVDRAETQYFAQTVAHMLTVISHRQRLGAPAQ